ncbi:MAG: 2-oxoacid:ferredoxin oxidoreductase subunit beta [Flavobacteriales bacterium]
MSNQAAEQDKFRAKDLETEQDVRWCPGCGDYAILAQTQKVLAELGHSKEDTVFISGIGCSSRFPYYMDTYGLHGIHGRAPAICSGLKSTRQDLSVWLITGDGDGLSIGGNHLIHLLRRNLDINVLLFNNEIYGLTKGQYSPTSPQGKQTVSTPMGSIDHPFNPLALCSGADGSFLARTIDREPRHMRDILQRGNAFKGTSMLEIYQNCNVFNDGAFFDFTDKKVRDEQTVFLEHGKPLIYGKESRKGVVLDGSRPRAVDLDQGSWSDDDVWVHDETDRFKAEMITRFFDDPREEEALPRPFGVIFAQERSTYDDLVEEQVKAAKNEQGEGDLDAILEGDHTWEV